MHRTYPAIIDRDTDRPAGPFGISFPDFPGCVSVGDTPEQAILSGTEALASHIALLANDGDAIPTPSSLDAIPPEDDPDVTVVCVTLVTVRDGDHAA